MSNVNSNIIYNIFYNIIFAPRYRRKLFLIKGFPEYLESLFKKRLEDKGLRLILFYAGDDYVNIRITGNGDSPRDIAKDLKVFSSPLIMKDFPELSKMQQVWTKNSIISTEPITDEEIADFLNNQKKRG